jgi:hypothetical protein
MAVCHVGATWGVQRPSMGSLYLPSRVECTCHQRMLSTQPTATDRSYVSAFNRIALWFPRSYLSEPHTLACLPKTTWNRQSNTPLPPLKLGTISSFIVLRALGELDCLPPTWQSGAWDSLVLRCSSGCDAIFPVLWKRRSNNDWHSMSSSLKRYRVEGNARMASYLCRFPLGTAHEHLSPGEPFCGTCAAQEGVRV